MRSRLSYTLKKVTSMNASAIIEEPVGAVHTSREFGEYARFPLAVKRILVPTDLSTESDRTIEYGLVLAQRFGARLTLLYVYRESYAVKYLRGPHASDAVSEERAYFQNRLKCIVEGVRKFYGDCDAEFREGQPCEEIVKTAKELDTDLMVISTHHYNWLTRLAYGCHAEEILRHAPCPLLILPGPPVVS